MCVKVCLYVCVYSVLVWDQTTFFHPNTIKVLLWLGVVSLQTQYKFPFFFFDPGTCERNGHKFRSGQTYRDNCNLWYVPFDALVSVPSGSHPLNLSPSHPLILSPSHPLTLSPVSSSHPPTLSFSHPLILSDRTRTRLNPSHKHRYRTPSPV